MARLARLVVPGYPHHFTQRGNRRQQVFFRDSDYIKYLELLREWCGHEGIEIWAYCLMTNHVHLIVTPSEYSNLGRAIGETHRRYTRMIYFREDWKYTVRGVRRIPGPNSAKNEKKTLANAENTGHYIRI